MSQLDKLLDKITKKVDQVEKLHDKESLLCEEVKDLIEEIRENHVEEDHTWEEEKGHASQLKEMRTLRIENAAATLRLEKGTNVIHAPMSPMDLGSSSTPPRGFLSATLVEGVLLTF